MSSPTRIPIKVRKNRSHRKVPMRHGRSTHSWRTSDPPRLPESETSDAELDIKAA